MAKSLTQSELTLFNQLANYYHDNKKAFNETLASKSRFIQQSFINWCQFEGLESIAKYAVRISSHKLFD